MAKHLVIVESPAKTKSIAKYLGKDYIVESSFGHIRTIPSEKDAIDTNTFIAKYVFTDRGKKRVKELVKYAKTVDDIYLCTDPDREGEAIAWHLYEVLREKGIKKPYYRVVFHEITKSAVLEAFNHSREIDMNLVRAQQARQNLDHIIGFTLSPLLWRAVAPGTSAGRVQSPALKLVCTRDNEINQFKPQEYWSITLTTEKDKREFKAKLIGVRGRSSKPIIPNEKEANRLKEICNDKFAQVQAIKQRPKSQKPKPPFITSTLQQDAVRKLGMTSAGVMSTAQKLYESGHITYMRTDSTVLSKDAVNDIRKLIRANYPDSLPASPRTYSNKAKNAQEAHEAIRPTNFSISLEEMKSSLPNDQYRLYELIYMRAIASQMTDLVLMVTTVEMIMGEGIFRASGSVVKEIGYRAIYEEDKDIDDPNKEEENTTMLPNLEFGDKLPNKDLSAEQHFTQPPPKLNEASLVKTLEELGIGRPSTYSSIITTLGKRKYIESEKKRFNISDLGEMVVKYLDTNFNEYMSYDFTSKMEDDLDDIAQGKKDAFELMRAVWNNLSKLAEAERARMKANPSRGYLEVLDELCPLCSSNLVVKLGKFGKFIACSGYPNCNYKRRMNQDSSGGEIIEGSCCPKCSKPLMKRTRKKDKSTFVGCSGYPQCNYIEGRVEPVDTGRLCPKCKKFNLFIRMGKFSKFLGCGGYPKKCRHTEPYEEDK